MTADTDVRLAQADAAARAALICVHDQAVHLDLTGLADGPAYRSLATIRFSCTEPGQSSWVDLAATTVHRVTLNGVDLDPAELVDGEHLRLPGLAADNELLVEATHEQTGARCGLSRSVDASDGSVYAWTQFEPYDAHRAWACFDQPDLKTVWSFTARLPADWTAVSNSAPLDVVDDGDCRVWTFGATPRLSAYVTAVCAGPFHVVRDTHGELPLGFYCRRSLARYLDHDVAEWVELTRQGLDFFGTHFGLPFPGDSYDQVFLPEMPGAMENFGCVTFSDSVIFRSEPSQTQRLSRAYVLLHEMAHMWFGDIVTMRWWDGVWLNESFATWAATWAAVSATRYTDAYAYFTTAHKARGYAADRSPTTHPISGPVPDVATAEASFDQITYAKGASVLRQLVAWVGEAEFLAGLRSYFDRYGWGNADLAGLLHELQVASGRDLTRWSSEWLQTAGTSTLRLVTTEDKTRYSGVRIEQSAPAAHPTLRSHRVSLGVYDRSDGTLVLRERIELDVTGERTDVPRLTDAPLADLLLLDDEDLTFATVALDARSQQTVLDAAGALPSAVARMVAVSSMHALVLDGGLAARDYVRCATAAARAEPVGSSLEQLLATATAVAARCAPPREQAVLLGEVAQACAAVADAAAPGSGHRSSALRALGRTATTRAQLDVLRGVLSDEAADQGLRWAALTRLVAVDGVGDEQIAAEQARDPDPDAPLRAFVARSTRPDPAVKAAVLDRLFGEDRPPSSFLTPLATAYWEPEQADLLAPYADRFLTELDPRQKDRGGWMAAWQLARLMFPTSGVDSGFADRVHLAAADAAAVPALRGVLLDAEDVLRRELRAQQR